MTVSCSEQRYFFKNITYSSYTYTDKYHIDDDGGPVACVLFFLLFYIYIDLFCCIKLFTLLDVPKSMNEG